jgi:tetratricopeptide (TPR) repeat protein
MIFGSLCFLFFYPGSGKPATMAQAGDSFYQGLRDFDTELLASPEEPEQLNRTLNRLEKEALGVESHLSLLKRRRLLAQQYPRFLPQYQKLAREAAAAFPFSQPLAAVAVESLLQENPSITTEIAASLRMYASRLSETTLMPVALGAYILAGDMHDPPKAVSISNKEALFSMIMPIPGMPDLTLDLMILRIFDGDIPGVTAQLNALLPRHGTTADETILRFAAEFFYDYGNPLWAAELFSLMSDEKSMIRQADALQISEHTATARNIWTMLAAPDSAAEIKARSLYNLAVTAKDQKDERAYLERFFTEILDTGTQPKSPKTAGNQLQADDPCYGYAIIRYTRLLDTPQSIAILDRERFRHNPLLDLELLRRRRETWSLERTVAETWLLLGRYPEDERLYQWGCYFFDYQKRYEETALLLKNAGYHHITGSWLDLHEGLRMVREGQLEAGEQRIEGITPQSTAWQVPANIARILEARRATVAALEYYQTAASLVREKENAARIQFRIGHCLRILGRDRESRQALEQALALNPDYLNARLELRRLDTQGIY